MSTLALSLVVDIIRHVVGTSDVRYMHVLARIRMLLESDNRVSEYDEVPDEGMLSRSISEPSLFEVLIDRYEEPLMRKAMSILGNRLDAEDAVQETFTKVYLNAKRFQHVPGATFKSWIYKILVNTALTQYRKNKRRYEQFQTLPTELIQEIHGDDSLLETTEIRDQVASALSRMPEGLARVLSLHFLEGKTHREIADVEGSSEGAVKTRVYRAKKVFRKIASSS